MNLFRMNNDIHKFLSFRYISRAYVEFFGEGIQICAFGCCGGYLWPSVEHGRKLEFMG